jgi:hypothetical protein
MKNEASLPFLEFLAILQEIVDILFPPKATHSLLRQQKCIFWFMTQVL